MASIEKRTASTGSATGTRSGRRTAGRSPARSTPTASPARSRSTRSAAHWIDPQAAPTCRSREWAETLLKASLGRCRRRRSRPTAETSTTTSSRASAPPPRSKLSRRGDRELAHRRARRRHRAVVGAPPLPHPAPHAPGRRREATASLTNPCDRGPPAHGAAARRWRSSPGTQAIAPRRGAPDRYLRPLIYLAVDSGMRWSELVGLRRSQRRPRSAARCASPSSSIRLDDGTWSPHRPEDRRRRPLDHDLGVHRGDAQRAPRRLVDPGPDDARVPRRRRAPAVHSSFQTHFWQGAKAKAGVYCRFHDLRHTSVALAIAAGAHPKAIQVRMGHSSITVTLDRYGHLFPELDEAIAAAFDQGWAAARAAAGVA